MSSERESLPINIFHLPFSLQSNHTPPPTHGASIFSFFDIFWHFLAFFHFMLGSAAFLPTASDPLLTQNGIKQAWLAGNNGKSAERTAVKSRNQSRNGSDLPLRQPTDQKANTP